MHRGICLGGRACSAISVNNMSPDAHEVNRSKILLVSEKNSGVYELCVITGRIQVSARFNEIRAGTGSAIIVTEDA